MPAETRQSITITIDGAPATVEAGSSVAVVMLARGVTSFRRSVTGESRAPLCGMGVCFECRVTIDGEPHQKSCQIVVAPNMDIVTDE